MSPMLSSPQTENHVQHDNTIRCHSCGSLNFIDPKEKHPQCLFCKEKLSISNAK